MKFSTKMDDILDYNMFIFLYDQGHRKAKLAKQFPQWEPKHIASLIKNIDDLKAYMNEKYPIETAISGASNGNIFNDIDTRAPELEPSTPSADPPRDAPEKKKGKEYKWMGLTFTRGAD